MRMLQCAVEGIKYEKTQLLLLPRRTPYLPFNISDAQMVLPLLSANLPLFAVHLNGFMIIV